MSRIIALFNHKGGVSKTTTTFNLGWALAEQGKKVLIVDGDPQCNLTGMVLGFAHKNDFEDFYTEQEGSNLFKALSPVIKGGARTSEACGNHPNGQSEFICFTGTH